MISTEAHRPEPEAPGPAREAREPQLALVVAAVVGSVCLIVVAVLALYARRATSFTGYDVRLLRDVRRHQTPWLVSISHGLADLGSIGTLVVIAVVIGLFLRWRGLNPLLCVTPFVALLVSGCLVEIIKVAIPRVGPHSRFDFGNQATGSFPSGHSADTTALAVALAIVLVAVVLRTPFERIAAFSLALALSFAVGMSRLVLGVHWPTDVVAGWALGLGTAVAIATLAVLATEGHGFAPSAAPPRR